MSISDTIVLLQQMRERADEALADHAFVDIRKDELQALLDDNAQLREVYVGWQRIFTGFPHDAQQAIRIAVAKSRELEQRLAEMTGARDALIALIIGERWVDGDSGLSIVVAELGKVGSK